MDIAALNQVFSGQVNGFSAVTSWEKSLFRRLITAILAILAKVAIGAFKGL
jgi:hypothetical protein